MLTRYITYIEFVYPSFPPLKIVKTGLTHFVQMNVTGRSRRGRPHKVDHYSSRLSRLSVRPCERTDLR